MKKHKKWIALIAAFLFALIFGSSLNAKPINNRAVVIGMAIDAVDEGGVEITAQILMTKGTEDKSLEGKEISAIGDTVAGALSQISISTSMDVSLAHCNLIILGGKMLEKNAYYPLDYLMRNAYLSENAMLVGTMEKAKDVLSSEIAFSTITSFYAQRALETQDDYIDVAQRTIKSFAVDQKSYTGANYLTLIEKIPLDKTSIETASSQDDSKSEQSEYYFNMEKTAIFSNGKMVGILSPQQTVGLNAVKKSVSQGSIELKAENHIIDLYIADFKASSELVDKSPTLSIMVDITALLKEINIEDGYVDSLEISLSAKEKEQAVQYLEDAIHSCFDYSKSLGVDIFDISGKMYRLHKIKNTAITDCKIITDINLEIE